MHDEENIESSGLSHQMRATLLKIVDVIVVVAGIAFALGALPYKTQELVMLSGVSPNIVQWSYPVALACCIPLVIAGVQAWLIFSAIGRDEAFTAANARRLNIVAAVALAEGIIAAVLAIALYALYGVLSAGFALLFAAGVVFAILANALSHLTLKAAAIKDENDLTV